MPLSCSVLKGLENNDKSTVLPIRHSFKIEDCEDENVSHNINPEEVAAQIINDAKKQAEEILAKALLEAEQLQQKTKSDAQEEAAKIAEDAYHEAYEKGRKEALDSAAQEADTIRHQARGVLQQTEEIRIKTLESMEPQIIQLAAEIAEKILTVKLNLDPQVVVDIAFEAINSIKEREQVILYVNPYEVGFFEERRPDLLKELSPKGELEIIADHEVEPGGCKVETEYGRVDAQLKTRWHTLMEKLGFTV